MEFASDVGAGRALEVDGGEVEECGLDVLEVVGLDLNEFVRGIGEGFERGDGPEVELDLDLCGTRRVRCPPCGSKVRARLAYEEDERS